MSNPPPLLAAKLDVPRLPPFHLPRPRLLRTLGTTTVTVITGAAGTGKTVLAAHWTRSGQAPGPVAWLRLDAEDNTPDVFWTFVLAALRAHLPRLDPADRPLVIDRAFLGRLAGQLSERQTPVVLVLDRADHHLRSRTIGRQLDSLLRYAGDGLRLILVGRGVRLLPLHHYQLADALTTLSTEDLALRPDETAELVALHGVRLDPSEVNRLHADTEGWITGVCLHARARRAAPADPGGARAAAHRAIGGFFRSEVLDALPGRVQELLLRNSLVRDVESGLADRLTTRYTAAGVLDELVRADAFVRQIDLSTYRIHRLFREVLSEELSRRHPGLVRRLHQRAARWYAEHDRTADAVLRGALLRAEVAARGEQYDAACEALREAFERARPDQQRRPFVLASAWIRPLLRGDPALAAEHAWLSCATDRPTGGPPSPAPAAAERLTNREVDVLRRLAQAQSTGDIAVDLHLSVNTVKSHLKSIYRKLGAHGRSQAARRARELHLLDDSRDAG